MTCVNCVHRIVCAVYAPNFDDILANGESCSEFKSKFNFVEVVRCDDCKYFIECYDAQTGRKLHYGICKINTSQFNDEEVKRNHYCGYGERRSEDEMVN